MIFNTPIFLKSFSLICFDCLFACLLALFCYAIIYVSVRLFGCFFSSSFKWMQDLDDENRSYCIRVRTSILYFHKIFWKQLTFRSHLCENRPSETDLQVEQVVVSQRQPFSLFNTEQQWIFVFVTIHTESVQLVCYFWVAVCTETSDAIFTNHGQLLIVLNLQHHELNSSPRKVVHRVILKWKQRQRF